MHLVVTFRDRAFSDFAARLEQIGSRMGVMAQALNEGGHALRQQTIAAETEQTGLPGGTLERAQKETPASSGSLTYTIMSEGGNVRLKYFGPQEGGGGVTAHPWNETHFYAGAFMTSGRPGARYAVAKLNGHVYQRVNQADQGWKRMEAWRKKKHPSKITQTRSGLFIPTEMTRGATAATFERGAAVVLNTIVKRLGSLMP